MSRDDLNDIPSFAANRDEAVSSAPRGAIPAHQMARRRVRRGEDTPGRAVRTQVRTGNRPTTRCNKCEA